MRTFFEPISVAIVEGKKRSLAGIDGVTLASWTQHIALGTRVRLRALLTSFAESLAGGQLLASMILLRAHLESAAVAALCLQELTKAADSGDLSKLGHLMLKTLFGTALSKHASKDEVAQFLSAAEGATLQMCEAVKALDHLYYGDSTDSHALQILYSLLCEYSHPNRRGTLHFTRWKEASGGWAIKYSHEEEIDRRVVENALESLLVTMRGGYSASALLSAWTFEGNGDTVTGRPPSLERVQWVWKFLLQRASPDAV